MAATVMPSAPAAAPPPGPEGSKAIAAPTWRRRVLAVLLERLGLVERQNEALRSRGALLAAIASAGERFFRTHWKEALPDVLAELGGSVGASRAYLFANGEAADGTLFTSYRFEWVGAGVTPHIGAPELQRIAYEADGYGRWLAVLSAGGVIVGALHELLPSERPLLAAQSIRSLAVVPVRVLGRFWGFLGFDDCAVEREWSAGEVEALRAAADLLGAAIAEKERDAEIARTAERLELALSQYRELVEHTLGFLITHDLDGRILSGNPATAAALGFTPEGLVGLEMRDLVPAEMRDGFDQALARLRDPAQSEIDGLMTLITAKGERRVLQYTSRRLEEPGKPTVVVAHALDVTENRRIESRLRQSEQRYRTLFEDSLGLICTHDMEGTILAINPAAAAALGRSVEEVTGVNLATLLAGESREKFRGYLDEIAAKGALDGALVVLNAQGEERVWQFHNRVLHESHQEPYVLGHATDVTERRRLEEVLRARALTDSLTGLANRSLFEDRLHLALEQAQRQRHAHGSEHPMALVYLDLDGFKGVNDRYGHAAGDAVLAATAARLSAAVRKVDTIARLGGDEFALILPEVRTGENAEQLAEKLIEALRQPIAWEGNDITVTVSIGIALYPQHGSDAETLKGGADAAMYLAKAAGKNQHRFAEVV
jgi:diguanylate cyclase (GGDEF)-like protein/PAS domain S-box-containing protein